MSRIGNNPVQVPKGVTVAISDAHIAIKGPKGELKVACQPGITVVDDAGKLVFSRTRNSGPVRAAHGLMRSLSQNAVIGVEKGWERKLEINGVGYRAEVSGKKLTMQLGFSHPIEFQLPDGVAAKVNKNIITVSGIDKQAVGQIAANIRSFRPPEPYKGKGVKYIEETIRRKVGKAAG